MYFYRIYPSFNSSHTLTFTSPLTEFSSDFAVVFHPPLPPPPIRSSLPYPKALGNTVCPGVGSHGSDCCQFCVQGLIATFSFRDGKSCVLTELALVPNPQAKSLSCKHFTVCYMDGSHWSPDWPEVDIASWEEPRLPSQPRGCRGRGASAHLGEWRRPSSATSALWTKLEPLSFSL